MSRVNVLSGLLVLVATVASLNFVSNRLGFWSLSDDFESISEVVKSKNQASSVGYLFNFDMICDSTAVKSNTGSRVTTAIACKCPSDVSWGGSAVSDGDYASSDWGGNVHEVWCAAASAVTCNCIGQVGTR